ncbi:MAG TPA: winged helix DNA-binding domain-containing protein [Blastocatellia bacterium]|nr:winged helix DNA-binding domain-containing protein [Blastocatellia bacterium]
MTSTNIANLRLFNQRIAGAGFEKPADVVAWLGAVQAQDYLGALWAVGLRMRGAVEADIERALADKTIVRTWPMRRTLHFVAAADVRWMLELLTPRILANSAALFRQLGLDEAVFTRSKKLFARALRGGRQLRRKAMYEVLEGAGISTAEGRGLHILSHLSQEGFLCFGAREGKQQTFALLDEWVPEARSMARDEALAELARRYFTSHGPATLRDFVWWSGLRTVEARASVEMAGSNLVSEVIDGHTCWLGPSMPEAKAESPAAYLLPPFDEYTVAYKDRTAVLDPSHAKKVNTGNGVFSPTIVMDGRVAGTWKRALRKDSLVITASPFAKLTRAETRALAAAADLYGRFIGAPVVLE